MSRSLKRIREAAKEDIPALLAIEEECFGTGFYARHGFDRRNFEYYLCRPNTATFLVEECGRPCGYILGLFGSGS